MSDEELVRAFEQGRVPDGGFHHADHVRVAWYYLRSEPLLHALVRFTTALRAFAAAQGKPDLYHETVTVAYMLLIADRLAAGRDLPWKTFAERNPDLLTWKPSILSRFYSEDVLWSDRARQVFLMPTL
jgi:hypothetical protein